MLPALPSALWFPGAARATPPSASQDKAQWAVVMPSCISKKKPLRRGAGENGLGKAREALMFRRQRRRELVSNIREDEDRQSFVGGGRERMLGAGPGPMSTEGMLTHPSLSKSTVFPTPLQKCSLERWQLRPNNRDIFSWKLPCLLASQQHLPQHLPPHLCAFARPSSAVHPLDTGVAQGLGLGSLFFLLWLCGIP